MKKTALTSIILLALAACTATNTASDDGVRRLPFSDTDGNSGTATFLQRMGGGKPGVAGEVQIALPNGQSHDGLDIVRMNDDLSIAAVDDSGKDRATDLPALANARDFTLYTFSAHAGTLEVGKFSAPGGVCHDYRDKGLRVAFADNKYLDHEQAQFVVFRSRGVIAARDAYNKNEFTDHDYSPAPGIQEKYGNEFEGRQETTAIEHYARANDMLRNGICKTTPTNQ